MAISPYSEIVPFNTQDVMQYIGYQEDKKFKGNTLAQGIADQFNQIPTRAIDTPYKMQKVQEASKSAFDVLKKYNYNYNKAFPELNAVQNKTMNDPFWQQAVKNLKQEEQFDALDTEMRAKHGQKYYNTGQDYKVTPTVSEDGKVNSLKFDYGIQPDYRSLSEELTKYITPSLRAYPMGNDKETKWQYGKVPKTVIEQEGYYDVSEQFVDPNKYYQYIRDPEVLRSFIDNNPDVVKDYNFNPVIDKNKFPTVYDYASWQIEQNTKPKLIPTQIKLEWRQPTYKTFGDGNGKSGTTKEEKAPPPTPVVAFSTQGTAPRNPPKFYSSEEGAGTPVIKRINQADAYAEQARTRKTILEGTKDANGTQATYPGYENESKVADYYQKEYNRFDQEASAETANQLTRLTGKPFSTFVAEDGKAHFVMPDLPKEKAVQLRKMTKEEEKTITKNDQGQPVTSKGYPAKLYLKGWMVEVPIEKKKNGQINMDYYNLQKEFYKVDDTLDEVTKGLYVQNGIQNNNEYSIPTKISDSKDADVTIKNYEWFGMLDKMIKTNSSKVSILNEDNYERNSEATNSFLQDYASDFQTDKKRLMPINYGFDQKSGKWFARVKLEEKFKSGTTGKFVGMEDVPEFLIDITDQVNQQLPLNEKDQIQKTQIIREALSIPSSQDRTITLDENMEALAPIKDWIKDSKISLLIKKDRDKNGRLTGNPDEIQINYGKGGGYNRPSGTMEQAIDEIYRFQENDNMNRVLELDTQLANSYDDLKSNIDVVASIYPEATKPKAIALMNYLRGREGLSNSPYYFEYKGKKEPRPTVGIGHYYNGREGDLWDGKSTLSDEGVYKLFAKDLRDFDATLGGIKDMLTNNEYIATMSYLFATGDSANMVNALKQYIQSGKANLDPVINVLNSHRKSTLTDTPLDEHRNFEQKLFMTSK